MTRQEIVDRFRHEISGAVLDALYREASGGELSILVRALLRTIDRAAGAAVDEAAKLPAPQTNGRPLVAAAGNGKN